MRVTARGGRRQGRTGSVVRRSLFALLAVLVASSVSLVWSLLALRSAARDADVLRSGYVPLLLSLSSAMETQNVVSTQLNHITEARNPSDAREWIETELRLRPVSFAGVRAAVEQGLRKRDNGAALQLADQVTHDITEIEHSLDSDSDRLARLFVAMERDEPTRAEALRSGLVQQEVAATTRLHELSRRVERAMDDLTARAAIREQRAATLLIALSLGTLLVGLAMALYTRRLLTPLAHVTERARSVARGELTPQQALSSNDEIGELSVAFEAMVEAIALARQKLVQAERLAAVGRMAAQVTHEIRNPISALGLNLELLQEELVQGASQEAQELARAIHREVERLAALSRQYLHLARRRDPELAPTRLDELLHAIASFSREELAKAHITLSVTCAPDVPTVMVDEGQLRQALLNLLRNAREALASGGSISLTLRLVSAPDFTGSQLVELAVADDGEGIAEELHATLFDPFVTTKRQGTGLGLAITRDIVEAHRGVIRCEAREPHGTIFRILLPLEPSTTMSDEEP